jgi:hypothetical protein
VITYVESGYARKVEDTFINFRMLQFSIEEVFIELSLMGKRMKLEG